MRHLSLSLPRPRLGRTLAVGTVALVVLGGSAAYATIPDSSGVVHTCYSKSHGNWRPIDTATTECRHNETELSFYSKEGADSAFVGLGTAAGGDLTGTYPNPSIAPNAVNGSKVADNSLTGADVDESTLGKVPSASHADSADTATTATNAAHANNADNAANANNANLLDGTDSSALLLHCPTGMSRSSDVCFDSTLQSATSWGNAFLNCLNRRLELPDSSTMAQIYWVTAAPGAEQDWTQDQTDSGHAMAIAADNFVLSFSEHAQGDELPYRCTISPSNNLGPAPALAKTKLSTPHAYRQD